MRALDTNVLARFILNDDPRQSPIATAAMNDEVYVSDTVLMELAWLLSSHFRFPRAVLADTLADLIQLPTVSVSDPALIAWSIERFSHGADFADMIHLLAARHTDGFVSFEKDLAKFAGSETPIPIDRLT